MLSFKKFIKNEHHKKGFDVNLWISPDGKVHFVNIFKEGKELEEGALDPNEPDITDGEGYKHFGEFNPTDINNKKLTAQEFHRHLAKQGLYSSSSRDIMHKDPHMQDFEDEVHTALGGKRHESWHRDYPRARTKAGEYVPRHATVYSSSGSSTHIGKYEGKIGKGDQRYNIQKNVKEVPGASSPGNVAVFNDETVYHRAPTKEERGDRHFIRGSGIREIPKEGIPKKDGSGYWNPNNEKDMNAFMASKVANNEKGMHHGLYDKIHNFMVLSRYEKEGSTLHKQRQALIAIMNHPDHRDRFNKGDWFGKTDWSKAKKR